MESGLGLRFEHAVGGRNDRFQRGRDDIGVDAGTKQLAASMRHLNIGDRRRVRAMLQRVLGIVVHRHVEAQIDRERVHEAVDRAGALALDALLLTLVGDFGGDDPQTRMGGIDIGMDRCGGQRI